MNRLTIIGNLTRDPESRTTNDGTYVCNFTVAVNRRKTNNNQQPEADFFKGAAWRQLGENCQKYLAKGRKAAVTGSADVYAWLSRNGDPRAQIEITADDVEFLSPRSQGDQPEEAPPAAPEGGYVEVTDEEDPF